MVNTPLGFYIKDVEIQVDKRVIMRDLTCGCCCRYQDRSKKLLEFISNYDPEYLPYNNNYREELALADFIVNEDNYRDGCVERSTEEYKKVIEDIKVIRKKDYRERLLLETIKSTFEIMPAYVETEPLSIRHTEMEWSIATDIAKYIDQVYTLDEIMEKLILYEYARYQISRRNRLSGPLFLAQGLLSSELENYEYESLCNDHVTFAYKRFKVDTLNDLAIKEESAKCSATLKSKMRDKLISRKCEKCQTTLQPLRVSKHTDQGTTPNK